MKLFNWLDNNIKKLHWYHISLVKLTVFFCTLFLITIWPAFQNVVLSIAWHWYLLITIVLMIPLLKVMFTE